MSHYEILYSLNVNVSFTGSWVTQICFNVWIRLKPLFFKVLIIIGLVLLFQHGHFAAAASISLLGFVSYVCFCGHLLLKEIGYS